MNKILNEHEINGFLSEVKGNFPNFVAGVITDRHGFPIAANLPQNFHIHEEQLALSAIAKNRDLIGDPRFMRVKRNLDKSKDIKLFLLLDKSSKYVNRFKTLNSIIESQALF